MGKFDRFVYKAIMGQPHIQTYIELKFVNLEHRIICVLDFVQRDKSVCYLDAIGWQRI